MGVLKGIGDFFTKDIPKFVTKTVPSAFKPETYAPELVPLRKEVSELKTDVTSKRETFYAEQARLSEARARYVELSDTYAAQGGSAVEISVPKTDRLTEELSKTDKTINDIAQAARTVTNVATLGLADLAFVHKDASEELKTLKRQKSVLRGTLTRLVSAIEQVVNARKAVDAQVKWIGDEMAKAGIEPGPSAASELVAVQAKNQARMDMAARLLSLGTDRQTVIDLTGLDAAELDTVSFQAADADEGDATDLLTDDERAALGENGKEHG